jgi:hypothetical protein
MLQHLVVSTASHCLADAPKVSFQLGNEYQLLSARQLSPQGQCGKIVDQLQHQSCGHRKIVN